MGINCDGRLVQGEMSVSLANRETGVKSQPKEIVPKSRGLRESVFENVVNGVGHFCFSYDGEWFQGNMISNDESIYQVSGRLCEDSDSESHSDDALGGSTASGGSSVSSTSEDETCRLYNLNVTDFETGFNYHLHRVVVRRGKRHCNISTPSGQLRFDSDHYYVGNHADVFLHSQFGPSFIDRGLRVYTGPLRFAYKEKVWRARRQHSAAF